MALDFAIIDNNSPIKQISISISLHQFLIKLAEEKKLKHFFKMKNFYEDASYHSNEITQLAEELEILYSSTTNQEIKDLLSNMKQFCLEALKDNYIIEVLSD